MKYGTEPNLVRLVAEETLTRTTDWVNSKRCPLVAAKNIILGALGFLSGCFLTKYQIYECYRRISHEQIFPNVKNKGRCIIIVAENYVQMVDLSRILWPQEPPIVSRTSTTFTVGLYDTPVLLLIFGRDWKLSSEQMALIVPKTNTPSITDASYIAKAITFYYLWVIEQWMEIWKVESNSF